MLRLILVALLSTHCIAFQGPVFAVKSPATQLYAKKKKSRSNSGQGFGSSTTPPPAKPAATESSSDAPSTSGLQSVESGASNAIPRFAPDPVAGDLNIPVEERTKTLLRDQYGLRTLEDQKREEKLIEQKRKIQKLTEEAKKDENFDIMAVLPAPLLIFIDRFLKIGAAISTLTFVIAGAGITLEAWATTTGNALPQNIDDFIVNTVEPNFTYGLVVLLSFSVSLGLFASAQLGSSGSKYSEDP